MKIFTRLLAVVSILLLLCGCFPETATKPSLTAQTTPTPAVSASATVAPQETGLPTATPMPTGESVHPEGIPPFTDREYVVLNNNQPYFTAEELTTSSYERYGELDGLGRCTTVMACIGKDLMPTEDRGEIGQIKPTGWHTVKYDCVNGKYLYNRCHLIGFQLTGENANPNNLITGTRYLNVEGMLPFENMVADYLREEEQNHVMYRVTPVFKGDNLVASGVIMEAYSVEDDGDGICFNVYCYNAQPQITIDYKTGQSHLSSDATPTVSATASTTQALEHYVLNTSSKKFHYPTCSSAQKIAAHNRQDYHGTRADLIGEGYGACGVCKP